MADGFLMAKLNRSPHRPFPHGDIDGLDHALFEPWVFDSPYQFVSHAEFLRIIEDTESEARRDPRRYRWRVIRLVALGYLYLFGIGLFLSVSLGLGLGFIITAIREDTPLSIASASVTLLIFSGLTLQLGRAFSKSDERELSRAEAPTLWRLLLELGERFRARPLHRVYVDTQFNASVRQGLTVRFGIIGPNEMTIGLPLMAGLSPNHFIAILGHEFGHLSHSHSWFKGLVYRLRGAWQDLHESAFGREDKGPGVLRFLPGLRRFLRWYVPTLGAHTFVLARADEFVADGWAVETLGSETAQEAEVLIAVKGAWFGALVDQLYARTATLPEPPSNAWTEICQQLRHGPDPEEGHRLLAEVRRRRTRYDDTHPCMEDRLQAYGAPAGFAETVINSGRLREWDTSQSAADVFLGARFGALCKEFDEQWKNEFAAWWREEHLTRRRKLESLKSLEERLANGGLGIRDLCRRAALKDELESAESGHEAYQEVLAADATNSEALMWVGEYRLSRGEESGLDVIREAMRRDRLTVPRGCLAIVHHLRATGRHDEIQQQMQEWRPVLKELELARWERAAWDVDSEFRQHGLPGDDVSRLAAHLAGNGGIVRAYLVELEVSWHTEHRQHILGIVTKDEVSADEESGLLTLGLDVLDLIQVPGEFVIEWLSAEDFVMESRWKRVPGAWIFDRAYPPHGD